jgi:hypothetical protein
VLATGFAARNAPLTGFGSLEVVSAESQLLESVSVLKAPLQNNDTVLL